MVLNALSMSVFALVFIAIFLGIIIRFSMIVSSILAFPIYLGLYAIEYSLVSKKQNNSILKFNLPHNYSRRYYTDLCASLITLCYLLFGFNIYLKVNPNNFVNDFFDGSFMPFPWSLLPFFLLTILYYISYKTPKDTRNIYDKIKSISFPGIFTKLYEKLIEK